MLIPPPGNSPGENKKINRRRDRKLWNDRRIHTPALGCTLCDYQDLCGGLQIQESPYDCLGFCCGKPENCDTVCPNKPFEFVDRVREIGSFGLETIPRLQPLPVSKLPAILPLIYHGSSRVSALATQAVGLSLYQMIDRRNGEVRYSCRKEIEKEFKLLPNTTIVLSGTAKDKSLERWWSLGKNRRIIIRQLRELGINCVTTPNYSLFTDQPRFDDLHSIKRIAITHHEFLSEGLPAALHVNARTETDWIRWTDYVGNRNEITHIAFEFGTGAGWSRRIWWHAEQLIKLAEAVDHPLHLIVRGGTSVFSELREAYDGISLLETSSFIKTMKRQRATISNNGVTWTSSQTKVGTPLDDLFSANVQTLEVAWAEIESGGR